jgi:hypothetical protein
MIHEVNISIYELNKRYIFIKIKYFVVQYNFTLHYNQKENKICKCQIN